MPDLVFDCKVELGMLWHAASRAVPCLLRIMLRIVLHVDLMPVICLLRRSSSYVVSMLKKFIVLCFIHSLYDKSGRLDVKPYDLPTNS